MTNKFTSRFRRRNEAAASTPTTSADATDTAKVADEANAAVKAESAAELAKPAVAAIEVAKPEVAKSETSKLDQKADGKPAPDVRPDAVDDKSAKPSIAQTVSPARLVEVEKPKVAPELSQAKAWLNNSQAYRMPAAAAIALVAALLAGYGLGNAGQARDTTAGAQKSAALLETTANDLKEAHGHIGQLAAEVKSLKGALEGMKSDREKSRGDIMTKQTQLSERLERTGQENATRIGRLAEQLDRIEKTQRDAGRQASVEKTDKPEKPHTVAGTPPLPPAKPNLDVAHTGSLPEAKPDPRKTPLDGYVIRDYDDGYALIETRSGRYIDVAVGYSLPGIGKVEAIERRGRQWVVVTPKGYIGER